MVSSHVPARFASGHVRGDRDPYPGPASLLSRSISIQGDPGGDGNPLLYIASYGLFKVKSYRFLSKSVILPVGALVIEKNVESLLNQKSTFISGIFYQ